ncbi:CBS domain-containing protein [Candidatus Bathyarchaeota archaeon]|jgi:CBS domain-containing protein|nr:CBS domain-containing protein [Candidatus Bathyarchaeota archaeon]
MSLEIKTEMLVREAMSSPVISVNENENMVKVAALMKEYSVGAIIIVNQKDKPVGIVTERDLVNRVIAEGKDPSIVRAKDVMSSPLKMVEPEMTLMKAMQLMDKLNIRRLGVMYKGDLVGVISDRNIIRLVPTIIDIMKERQEINQIPPSFGPSIAGYCDQCEMYSNNLIEVDGDFLCEECRMDL